MRRVLTISLVALTAAGAWTLHRVHAAAPSVQVQFHAENAQPRHLEDTTEQGVLRDYKTAWQNLATAMEQNRPDLLDASFVGFAHDKLGDAIAEQKKNGLRRRYIDHEHHVKNCARLGRHHFIPIQQLDFDVGGVLQLHR